MSIGAIVILGIIDLLIGILLLTKSTELPTLLKIFCHYVSDTGCTRYNSNFCGNVNLHLPNNVNYFGYVFST